MLDFILNGQAHGDVADRLLACNGDVGALRPFIGNDGRSYITLNVNGKVQNITTNSPATLRKDDWIQLDRQILKVAKNRLRAVADLRSAGLTYDIPNGMGKTVLQHETQSDIGPAKIGMDPISKGDNDRPVFELNNLPLPLIWKDFSFTARQLLVSRSGGSPLDTTNAELAARNVSETCEDLLIGNLSTYQFAGGTVYGYTNYTNRITYTLTAPTAAGWVPSTLVHQVLQMKAASQAAFHYGPWMVYCAPNWDAYLDDDYSQAKGDNTLRQRLRMIEGIQDVRTLDRLTNYDILMVQMSTNVVRLVLGMDFTTVQWDEHGGMLKNFKVMTMMVPELRVDQNEKTGLVHGSV